MSVTIPPIATGVVWTAAQWQAFFDTLAPLQGANFTNTTLTNPIVTSTNFTIDGSGNVRVAIPATGSSIARSVADRAADVANVRDLGAVADAQLAILLVSVAVGSSVLTVSLPPAWVASNAYSVGAVVTNNSRSYTCVVAGTSASSGGPITDAGVGATIVDGTAQWFYIGPAAGSANVFAPTDVGKILGVSRQDVYGGFNPWWSSASTYCGHVHIASYISPTSVTVDKVGNTAPSGLGTTYPAQTWPYVGTPSIIVWGTDNSPFVQAALSTASSVRGKKVYIPAGAYCFATQMIISSNTTIFGDGDSTILYACGVHNATPQANIVPMFVNLAYSTQSLTGWSSNVATTLRAQFGDRNIAMQDFAIRADIAGTAFGTCTVRFFAVDHIRVSRVNIAGSPLNCFEGVNFISCNDFQVSDSTLVNAGNGFDPWAGSTSGSFVRNRVIVAYNSGPNVTFGPGIHNAVEINVVGTSGTEQEVSDNYLVEDCDIFINGSSGTYNYSAGLFFWPGSPAGSIGLDVCFRNNRIFCTGSNNQPIQSSSSVRNLVIEENTVVGADGLFAPPISMVQHALNSGSSSNITGVDVQSGSSVATVHWPSHGYNGVNNSVLPIFFFVNNGPTGGGVHIAGYYLVTAVPDANTLTITLFGSLPTSTVTIPWASQFAQIIGSPVGCRISNNRLIDCASPSNYLISVSGIDIAIVNNESFLTSGATTGNYVSIAFFSNLNNQRGGVALNNTGPPGTGVGVAAGNARVSWNQFEPAPLVLDTDDLNTVVSLLGTDLVTGKGAAGATTDVSGHLLIPFCAGPPTGVPANASKGIAVRYDTTNHKFWAYDNGTNTWRGTVLS